MELELYSLNSTLIFCDKPGWFLSASSLEICKHCFAMLFSGRVCKCIQNLRMEVSIFNFKDNLPSSFLAATFGHRLFTPRDCLQRKYAVFFNYILFPSTEIIFIIDCPYLRSVEKNWQKE